ncbi:MAG: hypothetical protein WBA41_04770 [Rivularia sp. (in: cyanobacteria)]
MTGIVLLTGKEVAELFDDNLLSWNWQRWVTVNPRFAETLNRMLSHKPGGRYQRAVEVLEALDSINQPTAAKPDVSRMQTVAVGARKPDPVPVQPVQPPPRRQAPPVTPKADPVVDSPLAVILVGAAVVTLGGLGSWALVKAISNSSNSPSPPAQTVVTPTPTPDTDEPEVFSKRLNFGLSNTANVTGSLKENQTVQYSLRGEEAQVLTAVLVEENGVSLTVLGPNKELVDGAARRVSSYQGDLPFTGRYTIELNNLPGTPSAEYTLKVTLKDPVTATPTPSVEPTPDEPTQPPEENTPTPEAEQRPKLPNIPNIKIPDNIPTSIPTSIPTPKIPRIKIPSIKRPNPSEENKNNPEVEPTPESENSGN